MGKGFELEVRFLSLDVGRGTKVGHCNCWLAKTTQSTMRKILDAFLSRQKPLSQRQHVAARIKYFLPQTPI